MNKIIKKTVSAMMIGTLLVYTMPVLAYTNEETIYSKLDASGNVYKNIASIIEENEKGTESTQEEIDKDLPVDCKITYTLDGKVVTAEEIAGKSGNVNIEIEYINKLENKVNIGGKTETIYTPFVVISGVVIDNDIAKDIKISNGKIINNGSKTIAVGFALPGMKESLDVDKDIPNKIEISMQVENFELGNIMSFATPKVLEEGTLDDIYEELDDVYSQVYDLEDASKQLEDGTITLRDGIITLNNGAKDLRTGASNLNDGANKLNNGAKDLKTGIDTLKAGSTAVNEGATTLKNGTAEYSANSNVLNENVQKMSAGTNTLNSGYSQVDGGIKQIQNTLPNLLAGTAGIKGALEQNILSNLKNLNAGLSAVTRVQPTTVSVNSQPAEQAINDAVNALHSVNTSITAEVNTSSQQAEIQGQIDSLNATKASLEGMVATTPELQGAIDTINSSIATLEGSKAVLASASVPVTSNVDLSSVESSLTVAQSAVSSVSTVANTPSANSADIQALVDGYNNIASALETQIIPVAMQVDEGAKALSSGIQTLSEGSEVVKNGISNLNTSAEALSAANNKLNTAAQTIAKGANDLANGTQSLDAGVAQLSQGSNTLTAGANELANGTGTLLNGTNTLADGTGELLDGGNTLVEGVQKFNQEGIKKITDLVNVDVKNTENRIRKMEDLSQEYQRFASDMSRDDIKFINIVDAIKKKK